MRELGTVELEEELGPGRCFVFLAPRGVSFEVEEEDALRAEGHSLEFSSLSDFEESRVEVLEDSSVEDED